MGMRAPRAPSIVDGFSLLPELLSVAGSVAPDICLLARAAARALLAVIRVGVQNESTLATIRDRPGAVEPVGKWPKYVVRALPLHDGRSNSPAQ